MKPRMTCERAYAVLASLSTGAPAFTAAEIEELIAAGLVVELDPRDRDTLAWLVPAVQELAGCDVADPLAPARLAEKLGELTEKLRSDWYRFTHSQETIRERERQRHLARRSLALLGDERERERLATLVSAQRQHGQLSFVVCEALGSELYALTSRGRRVGYDLQIKLARFADQPFAAFMKAFDKSDAKMATFSRDIAELSRSVGTGIKNPHQVVIGLAKTGVPANHALHMYHDSLRRQATPADAVTCARNAAAHGNPQQVARRLQDAQRALQRAGVPMLDATRGAAKTLLPFEPLADGARRFAEIFLQLESNGLTRGELTIKSTARLMPATGSPAEVVQRALVAHAQLAAIPSRESRASSAVAIASMVRDDAAVVEAAHRLLAIHAELLRRHISSRELALADALECMSCPGTPAEVAETVHALIQQLAAGRAPRRADTAVAVAFAKRFAY